VLTLTATPIPRTLQMAMSGLARAQRHPDAAGRSPRGADLRHAVGPGRAREALLREHYRGGPELFRRAADFRLPDIEKFLREQCRKSATSSPTGR
jgi:transcription-repair coupling factor (superfamily II helicase)